jgi:hypothetical protein
LALAGVFLNTVIPGLKPSFFTCCTNRAGVTIDSARLRLRGETVPSLLGTIGQVWDQKGPKGAELGRIGVSAIFRASQGLGWA